MFLQRPSNPNHNHVLYYNHECWALWAQGPTLMYNHECFYNDPVTLIATMYFTTTTSAGPLGPTNPNVQLGMFLQRPSNPNHNHVLYYKHECWALWAPQDEGPTEHKTLFVFNPFLAPQDGGSKKQNLFFLAPQPERG